MIEEVRKLVGKQVSVLLSGVGNVNWFGPYKLERVNVDANFSEHVRKTALVLQGNHTYLVNLDNVTAVRLDEGGTA